MSATYAIYTSPSHKPVADHLPTLIVCPHGKPSHILYTYLHTNFNRENYLLTPSDTGDLCVAKLFPPDPHAPSRSAASSSSSHGGGPSNSHAIRCEASRNLRWTIKNEGVQHPVYKLTLPNPDNAQQEQPLFQVSKPNPHSPWWTLFYFTYAGHLIPPKRIEFGKILKNQPGNDGKAGGGGTKISVTGKTDEEKAVWKTLGEGNEDMVEWIIVCAALNVLDDEITRAAEAAGIHSRPPPSLSRPPGPPSPVGGPVNFANGRPGAPSPQPGPGQMMPSRQGPSPQPHPHPHPHQQQPHPQMHQQPHPQAPPGQATMQPPGRSAPSPQPPMLAHPGRPGPSPQPHPQGQPNGSMRAGPGPMSPRAPGPPPNGVMHGPPPGQGPPPRQGPPHGPPQGYQRGPLGPGPGPIPGQHRPGPPQGPPQPGQMRPPPPQQPQQQGPNRPPPPQSQPGPGPPGGGATTYARSPFFPPSASSSAGPGPGPGPGPHLHRPQPQPHPSDSTPEGVARAMAALTARDSTVSTSSSDDDGLAYARPASPEVTRHSAPQQGRPPQQQQPPPPMPQGPGGGGQGLRTMRSSPQIRLGGGQGQQPMPSRPVVQAGGGVGRTPQAVLAPGGMRPMRGAMGDASAGQGGGGVDGGERRAPVAAGYEPAHRQRLRKAQS